MFAANAYFLSQNHLFRLHFREINVKLVTPSKKNVIFGGGRHTPGEYHFFTASMAHGLRYSQLPMERTKTSKTPSERTQEGAVVENFWEGTRDPSIEAPQQTSFA